MYKFDGMLEPSGKAGHSQLSPVTVLYLAPPFEDHRKTIQNGVPVGGVEEVTVKPKSSEYSLGSVGNTTTSSLFLWKLEVKINIPFPKPYPELESPTLVFMVKGIQVPEKGLSVEASENNQVLLNLHLHFLNTSTQSSPSNPFRTSEEDAFVVVPRQ